MEKTIKDHLQDIFDDLGAEDQRTFHLMYFIDRNWTKLIGRVSNVDGILDELLQMRIITDENYDNIRAEKTSQNRMRELLTGPIKSAGTRGKDALYKALKEVEPCLTEELEGQ